MRPCGYDATPSFCHVFPRKIFQWSCDYIVLSSDFCVWNIFLFRVKLLNKVFWNFCFRQIAEALLNFVSVSMYSIESLQVFWKFYFRRIDEALLNLVSIWKVLDRINVHWCMFWWYLTLIRLNYFSSEKHEVKLLDVGCVRLKLLEYCSILTLI